MTFGNLVPSQFLFSGFWYISRGWQTLFRSLLIQNIFINSNQEFSSVFITSASITPQRDALGGFIKLVYFYDLFDLKW